MILTAVVIAVFWDWRLAAIALSDQPGDTADALVGHFVDRARRAGACRSEMRQHGRQRQSAQKRFVSKDTTPPEPLIRAGASPASTPTPAR